MLVPLTHAAGLRVEEYHCQGLRPDVDERNDRHEIVFVRRGAFQVEAERGRALADAQHLLLFHRGERFRVRHPAGCGDRCLVLGFDDELLAELLGTPAIDEGRPEAPFRALTLPCSRRLHAAAERFRVRLSTERDDPLVAAEELLALVVRVLGADVPAAAARLPRRATTELVESVRLELVRRLGDRLPLPELARAVGVSPFHLARLFRRETGSSLHQYRVELRLREAHARLTEGAADLTTLALDLGFADHAHFSNAFRRRYGAAPSRVRAAGRAGALSAPRPTRRPTAPA